MAFVLFGLSAIATAQAASCTVGIGDIDFGSVDSLYAAPVDSAASVHVDCDQVSAGASEVVVCIHFGAGSGGSEGGQRKMVSGNRTLGFQLYQDANRSVPWGGDDARGIGPPRRVVVPVSGETASTSIDVYARVFGSQSTAAVGSYASSFAGTDASFGFAEGALDCAAPGGAGSGQTAFAVAATVSANCMVETTDIDFGQHGIIDRDIDAEGAIDVTCTPDAGYFVTLGPGLGGGNDPEQRILRSGSDVATYGLYLDAARSQPWGSSLETQLPGTGAGTRQTLPVYGRVPRQAVRPGSYSDTVAVTITYGAAPGV
ncbi:spore coat protein U domain-containing protein [Aureimonas sp. SA4125]|uniref:Csu type fimbrial protein n=1 Tax=Aureimonas sp. SA4125 TaxID=2826993 RepID=UPI001CC73305|nr:spore coat protein U domain-containing protein [Aureimonas sp. SA4125]